MARDKKHRERPAQRARDTAPRRSRQPLRLPTWARIQVRSEVWIVAVFLGLGVAAVLVASFLSALGGPNLDLTTLIGAIALIAVTILLAFFTISQPDDELDDSQLE